MSWFPASRFSRRRSPGKPYGNKTGSRLTLEQLEDRLVPATFLVVPAASADGSTTFASLSQALSVASSGDTIQIEPGSSPGGAYVRANDLTIQGDPAVGSVGLRASGTPVGAITFQGNNNTLTDLFLNGGVYLDAAATGATVGNCIFINGGISQTFGTGTNGDNTIIGNTFLDFTYLSLGNTYAGGAANDRVINNYFPRGRNNNLSTIKVQNETAGLVISGNVIEQDDPALGINAADCVGTISNNTIHGGFTGIAVGDNGSGDTLTTNVTVTGNAIVAHYTAVVVARGSTVNSFTVSVANNSLFGTLAGLQIIGNGAGAGPDDFGDVSAGGTNGQAASVGGNDFCGLTVGHAITVVDDVPIPTRTLPHLGMPTIQGTIQVFAQHNLIGPGGPLAFQRIYSTSAYLSYSVDIDTSNPLTGGAAGLTAMFQTLGGGPPNEAQLSALGRYGAAQQAQAALLSSQATSAFITRMYVQLLGRNPAGAEVQFWSAAVQNGSLNEEQVLVGFLTSPEYYGRVTTGSANPDGTWIQSLYHNLLGRAANGDEVNLWLNGMASGHTAAARAFVNSTEFRGDQVQGFYGAAPVGAIPTADLLKRLTGPSAAEIDQWVHSGLDLLTMQGQMLASAEFAANG